MFGFLRKLFAPQKIEIIVNVPTIQVTVQQQKVGGTIENSISGCGSRAAIEQGTHQFLVAPKVSDEAEIDENRLKSTKPVARFGQEKSLDQKRPN